MREPKTGESTIRIVGRFRHPRFALFSVYRWIFGFELDEWQRTLLAVGTTLLIWTLVTRV